MNYIVYMHRINNKVYIGITCNIVTRWAKGFGYRENKAFYQIIKQVGWDNIEHIIIAEGLSQTEAETLEENLIKQYDSTNPEHGFNKYASAHESFRYSAEQLEHLRKTTSRNKAIQQLDVHDNHVIAEYVSSADAARQLNANAVSLNACVNGRMLTYKGFKWRLKP